MNAYRFFQQKIALRRWIPALCIVVSAWSANAETAVAQTAPAATPATAPQTIYPKELEAILSRFSNYRYSDIRLLEVSGDQAATLINAFDPPKVNPNAQKLVDALPKEVYTLVNQNMVAGKTPQQIIEDLSDKGITNYDQTQVQNIIGAINELNNPQGSSAKKVYIITNKFSSWDNPRFPQEGKSIDVLGLVLWDQDTPLYSGRTSDGNAVPKIELKVAPSTTSGISANTYEDYLIDNVIARKQAVDDVTLKGQELARQNSFFNGEGPGATQKVEGEYESAPNGGYRFKSETLPTYMRISEGMPSDYIDRRSEVIVSYDLISYRYFRMPAKAAADAQKKKDTQVKLYTDSLKAVRDQLTEVRRLQSVSDTAQLKLDLDAAVGAVAELTDANEFAKRGAPSLQQIRQRITAVANALNNRANSYSNQLQQAQTTPVSAFSSNGVVYNNALPQYGVELRYGMDDINYISLFSERMAVNAVWENVRLGVILPTSGWASFAEDIGNRRRLASAGWGLNGAADFPVDVIQKSGVFHVSTGYVVRNEVNRRFETDYLVRFNGSFQYSFAARIDSTHLLRFRVGGTGYVMETWTNAKIASQTIIGLAGNIEYMNTGVVTPFGGGAQYFDESLSLNAWLQVPLWEAGVYLRPEVRYSSPVFRTRRPWELQDLFFPTVRVVWTF
jgi:hypothetical protein